MTEPDRFIFLQSKAINIGSIAYVDFLESGRAMIHMRGLSLEKQNIPVDVNDAKRLKAFLEAHSSATTLAA